MAIELFGASLSPYAAVTCVVSFLMVGHRSVYPSQILAITKSSSISPDLGNTLDEMDEIAITSRDRSVFGLGRKVVQRLRRRPEI
jgi:hypothetical protein